MSGSDLEGGEFEGMEFSDQELLEYLFGCLEEPERLEAALAQRPDLRARLEAARATQGLLASAATDDSVGPLTLGTPREARSQRLARSFPALRLAAVLAGVLLAGAWGWSAYASSNAKRLDELNYLAQVKALPSVPAGASRSLQLSSKGSDGQSVETSFSWQAFDESGRVVTEDQVSVSDPVQFNIPATMADIRRFEVTANRTDEPSTDPRRLELLVGGEFAPPMVHLTTDKPLYRPGERVYVRAVLLDRLTNTPLKGRFRLRVTDPKGASLASWTSEAVDGVVAGGWFVSLGSPGGQYHIELQSGFGTFAYERLGFEVRRFEPPLLSKSVTLSRRTFAPGERGAAEVVVDRIAGGGAAGAEISATVLVDGERVWGEMQSADERGRAGFSFDLPEEVLRGEGRFVARIRLGGIVETVVEPFAIPTGEITAKIYPESGALIVGAAGRVYFEALDANERPVSGHGWVVDANGLRVGDFRTEHLGRGRFELTPEAGQSYFLDFEVPASQALIAIPTAVERGAVLSVTQDGFGAREAVSANVQVLGAGPEEQWTAGLFCRGRLVAKAEGQGADATTVELLPAENVGGVLRLTLFDANLQPLAERLVHRMSSQRIEVSVTPSSERTLPGEHQVLDVVTRDEAGRPVAAVVGLTVTDRAVRAEAGVARVGLADQVGLFGDLEWDGPALEERGELLRSPDVRDDEHARRVDLLLGTRGWRRFAWVDRDACIAEFGDAGERLLAREGYADKAIGAREDAAVFKSRRDKVRNEQRRARAAKRRATAVSVLLGLLAISTVIWRIFFSWFRNAAQKMGAAPGWSAAIVSSILTVLLVVAGGAAWDMHLQEWSTLGTNGAAVMVEAGIEAPGEALGLPQVRGTLGEPRFEVASLSEEMRLVLLGSASERGEEDADVIEPRSRDLQRVRVYAHQSAQSEPTDIVREDFTETVYWNALLRTSVDGRARVEFDVSDRPTTWQVFADAHGAERVGQGAASFLSTPVVRMEPRIPVELTAGDRVQIPVAVTVEGESGRGEHARALIGAAIDGPVKVDGELPSFLGLEDGQGRFTVPIVAESTDGVTSARLALGIEAAGFEDRLLRKIRVVPRGFPQRVSESGRVGAAGQASASHEFLLAVPDAPVEGSLRFELKVYPSPVADLLDGADGMLQIPRGCFEQASATNYPNVLALAYLEAAGVAAPAVRAAAEPMLERGYELLTGYECASLGYEWFGHDPGHEVLSAYGLLQFTDMAKVFDVKAAMLKRTSDWLLGRRDGKGGYELDPKSLDSFGRAPKDVTNAYCTYALAVSGVPAADLKSELDRAATRAAESDDPYEVAAAACALSEAGRAIEAEAGRDRLKSMQSDDGSLVGTTASITRSGDRDLVVETTAFAVMAWLDQPEDAAHVDRAMQFLLTQRQGSGRFGSTQATIMALRAITMYAGQNRTAARAGEIVVYINDHEAKREAFEDGAMEAIKIDGLVDRLTPGINRVRLELTNGNEFPWVANLEYFAEVPADAPDAQVDLAIALDRTSCIEGDTVGLDLTVTNLTDDGQPMTMAIVGLPAGLEVATKVLDDMVSAGRFDLWERNGREVILYWRDMAPRAELAVHLDLVATIPGTTTGPASRVYLYYTQDQTRWAEPLSIEISPLK